MTTPVPPPWGWATTYDETYDVNYAANGLMITLPGWNTQTESAAYQELYDPDYGSNTAPQSYIVDGNGGAGVPVSPAPTSTPTPTPTPEVTPLIQEPNQPLPGSPGGVVETVKRGVISALRLAVTGSSMSVPGMSSVHVDLEYPIQEKQYPGIWVQFSLRELQIAGLGHEYSDPEGGIVREWSYRGDVTLTLVALTSIERDRLADLLISYFAFSRPNADSAPLSPLYQSLADNPYLSITVNSDQLLPGGQSVTVGVPWDPDRLAYEDNYKFNVVGQFQSVFIPTEGVTRLQRIKLTPDVFATLTLAPSAGQWI